MKKCIQSIVLILPLFIYNLSFGSRLENCTLWENSTIAFEIDKKFTFEETNLIIDALNEMMIQTNLVFKNHIPNRIENYTVYTKVDPCNEFQYLHAATGGICPSGYGRLIAPLPQAVNFWTVSKGTVKHETMHALGFNHEQGRSDRDTRITIVDSNVIFGWEFNFWKLPGGRDIGVYDFNSIMHYRFNSGSKNENLPTMIRIDSPANRNFGNAHDLSPTDILAINTIYPFRPPLRPSLAKLQFIAVGKRRTIRVEAKNEYNFFNIPVEAGQVYRLDAFNRDVWKSSAISSTYTADGKKEKVGCKRVPTNKFMRMLCDIYSIEEKNAANFTGFRFGVNTNNNNMTEFTVQENGEGYLMFYANDCNGTYLDNSDSIGVHVSRIR